MTPELAHLLDTINARGRAYTGDLLQAGDYGVDIADHLVGVAGDSVDDVWKATSRGEVSADMFTTAAEIAVGVSR